MASTPTGRDTGFTGRFPTLERFPDRCQIVDVGLYANNSNGFDNYTSILLPFPEHSVVDRHYCDGQAASTSFIVTPLEHRP